MNQIKNKFFIMLLPLLLSIFLAACSSNKLPDVTPIFHSEIKEDDGKFFHFYLLVTKNNDQEDGREQRKSAAKPANGKERSGGGRGKKGNRGNEGGQGNGKSGQNSASAQSERNKQRSLMLVEQLNDQLEQNNYCRQGYIVLEENIGRGILSIKGECHESATEKDRLNFPNRKLSPNAK